MPFCVLGASGPVCGLFCQSPQIHWGVQCLQQCESLSAESSGAPASRTPAPEECTHQADEGFGLWQRLQVQPYVQRACGPGLPAWGTERNWLLQAEAVLTFRPWIRCLYLEEGQKSLDLGDGCLGKVKTDQHFMPDIKSSIGGGGYFS